MIGTVTIRPDREGIPAVLREREQWVGWQTECRDCGTIPNGDEKDCQECGGDITKVPYNAITGGRAKPSDSDDMNNARETWSDFETVWDYYNNGTDADGVGFVFDPDSPFVGIDLDDCRDPSTKNIDPWARDIVTKLDSYTEISPSGTGIHIIVRGTLPDGGNKRGGIEMYDSRRFFTVTGQRLEVNL